MNELIRRLYDAYAENPDENILAAIRLAEQLEGTESHNEDYWREQELVEAFSNMAALPHSVRTWLTDLRDKEME